MEDIRIEAFETMLAIVRYGVAGTEYRSVGAALEDIMRRAKREIEEEQEYRRIAEPHLKIIRQK